MMSTAVPAGCRGGMTARTIRQSAWARGTTSSCLFGRGRTRRSLGAGSKRAADSLDGGRCFEIGRQAPPSRAARARARARAAPRAAGFKKHHGSTYQLDTGLPGSERARAERPNISGLAGRIGRCVQKIEREAVRAPGPSDQIVLADPTRRRWWTRRSAPAAPRHDGVARRYRQGAMPSMIERRRPSGPARSGPARSSDDLVRAIGSPRRTIYRGARMATPRPPAQARHGWFIARRDQCRRGQAPPRPEPDPPVAKSRRPAARRCLGVAPSPHQPRNRRPDRRPQWITIVSATAGTTKTARGEDAAPSPPGRPDRRSDWRTHGTAPMRPQGSGNGGHVGRAHCPAVIAD